jgi:predicted TIM-barrel fold metal-dependent hydrolase
MTNAARILRWLAGVAALTASASLAVAADAARPIVDTHIHLYQVTRPGGVPWPPPGAKLLYKDMLPAGYQALAAQHGVVGVGVVEASPLFEDNLAILAMTRGNKFFRFLVANLEIGSADFVQHLDVLAKDPRVVGIRGFLWAPTLTLDEKQLAHLRELARRGMTLDLISRRTLNPKDKVLALAQAVPDLRIIIDHLGGAKGEKPDPQWVADMKKLAEQKNVYVKFSSFFDVFNPTGREDEPWKAPREVAMYKPHFDVLMQAFGPDRLVFGSNYPVVELGGGFASEIELAEQYLAPLGKDVRDKVMFKNAEAFYKRVVPKAAGKGGRASP